MTYINRERSVRDSRYSAAAFATRRIAPITVNTNATQPNPAAIPTQTIQSPTCTLPLSLDADHPLDCMPVRGGGE